MEGAYTLYCGDCAVVMAEKLADESVDLTVTSPPYDNLRVYEGYTFDFEAIAAQLWRVTKPGGVVVWVVADATINGSETGTSFRQALHFMSLGFNLHDTMAYGKDRPPGNDGRYQPVFEFMFVFSKGRPKTFNPIMVKKSTNDKRKVKTFHREARTGFATGFSKSETNLRVKDNYWFYVAGGGNATKDKLAHQHPAIFPEALAHDHIISWSNPGDLVLDPMVGSGTTGKVAVATGRRFIGIDISAKYLEIARKRVDRAVRERAGKFYVVKGTEADIVGLPLFDRRHHYSQSEE